MMMKYNGFIVSYEFQLPQALRRNNYPDTVFVRGRSQRNMVRSVGGPMRAAVVIEHSYYMGMDESREDLIREATYLKTVANGAKITVLRHVFIEVDETAAKMPPPLAAYTIVDRYVMNDKNNVTIEGVTWYDVFSSSV